MWEFWPWKVLPVPCLPLQCNLALDSGPLLGTLQACGPARGVEGSAPQHTHTHTHTRYYVALDCKSKWKQRHPTGNYVDMDPGPELSVITSRLWVLWALEFQVQTLLGSLLVGAWLIIEGSWVSEVLLIAGLCSAVSGTSSLKLCNVWHWAFGLSAHC